MTMKKSRKFVLLALTGVAAIGSAYAVRSAVAGPAHSGSPIDLHARGNHVVQTERAESIRGLNEATSAVPPKAAAILAQLSGGPAGAVEVSHARVLLNSQHAWGGSFYAAPSSGGQVCYLIGGGPASCVSEFTQANPIAWTKFDGDGSGGNPPVVAGIVPNDVVSVSIVDGGSRYDAPLSNNAFLFEFPEGAKTTDSSIVLGYRDGTQLTQPLAVLHSEMGQ